MRTVDGGIGLGPGADRGASAGAKGRRVGETQLPPAWLGQQDRGLPPVASTTPLFLPLRLPAGFVGTTRGWPRVLGLLPWGRGRGKDDSGSGKGTQLFRGPERTHVGEVCAGRDWVHEEGRGGAVTRGRKGDLSGGCLDFQPAQLLNSFVSAKCDLSLLGATGVKASHLGWGWRGSRGQGLGLGTLPGPLI